MSKEAMKLALEALEHLQPTALTSFYTIGDRDKAIAALREALAEQPAPATELREQEPVKVKTCDTCQFGERCNQWSCKNHSLWKPLQPAQQEQHMSELTKVEEAILGYWGGRCSTFESECPVCQAWVEFDIKTAFGPSCYPALKPQLKEKS